MKTINNFINEYRNAPVKTKNELVVIIEDLLNNTAFDPFNITTDNSDIASKTYVAENIPTAETPTLQEVITAGATATGDVDITGSLDVDNLTLNGNDLSSSDNLNIYQGTGKSLSIGTLLGTNVDITTGFGGIFSVSEASLIRTTATIGETGSRVTKIWTTDITTSNAVVQDSDMNLKDLVARIDNATTLLKSLPQAIKYTWKPFELNKKNVLDEEGNPIILEPEEKDEKGNVTKEAVYQQESILMDSTTPHFGFSAQEMKKVFPEIVGETPAGSLTLSYTELIPFLVEGFKELASRVDSFEARISALENK